MYFRQFIERMARGSQPDDPGFEPAHQLNFNHHVVEEAHRKTV